MIDVACWAVTNLVNIQLKKSDRVKPNDLRPERLVDKNGIFFAFDDEREKEVLPPPMPVVIPEGGTDEQRRALARKAIAAQDKLRAKMKADIDDRNYWNSDEGAAALRRFRGLN